MIEVIEVKWIIEERELPGVGLVSPGKTYEIQKDVAESLIKQGHAKRISKSKKGA